MMRNKVDKVNDTKSNDADAVLESIHDVMHLFRAQQYRSLRDGALDLTHMEGKVLGFFARHPGATQRDLAAHSGRDKGQLARLISGLKSRELLEVSADEDDRRSLRLHLTAAGRGVQQTLQRQGRRLSNVAVHGLTMEDRRQLLELLARVHSNLSDPG